MHDLIRRIAEWLRLMFSPGTGTHRRGAHLRPVPTPVSSPAPHPLRAARPPCFPYPRSPYGVPASLDGSALAVVRPYVVAHERERARQRHRRLALVLAADFGVDLDRHLVGASGVGGAVDTAFGAGVMTDVRKAAA